MALRDLARRSKAAGSDCRPVARGDLGRPDIAGGGIHRQMHPAILAPAMNAMLARRPLATAEEPVPGAAGQQAQQSRCVAAPGICACRSFAAGLRRGDVQHRPVKPGHRQMPAAIPVVCPGRQVRQSLHHQAEPDRVRRGNSSLIVFRPASPLNTGGRPLHPALGARHTMSWFSQTSSEYHENYPGYHASRRGCTGRCRMATCRARTCSPGACSSGCLALSVTDAQSACAGTLWLAGTKSKYYDSLAGWYRATGGDPALTDGITRASVGVDMTPEITLDLVEALFDAGYTLHVDTAIKDMRDSSDDVTIPLATQSARGQSRGEPTLCRQPGRVIHLVADEGALAPGRQFARRAACPAAAYRQGSRCAQIPARC